MRVYIINKKAIYKEYVQGGKSIIFHASLKIRKT
jgi:hypothetical protein